MKRSRVFLLLLSFLFFSAFCFRNHFRLLIMRRFPPAVSVIKKEDTRHEENFTAEIFQCRRTYRHSYAAAINRLFTDQLLVIRLPLKQYAFNNLVLPPVGKDRISDHAVFYFNTLFFHQDFSATTGIIDNGEVLNKRPRKKRVGLDPNGNLTVFSVGKNGQYNDVFQAPYLLRRNTTTNRNFHTLNYRQFIAVRNNELIYMSGHNNSLVSWKDIKALMHQMNLETVIALDGGASLDYFFAGKNNNYSFSSVPFRWWWFDLNSPYYLEGKLKY